MKILVTGGAGFIGSHLVDALIAANHQVMVLDDLSTGKKENLSPKAQFVLGDITQPGIFLPLLENMDACVHLAAIASVEKSRLDLYRSHQVNVGSLINLYDAIAKTGGEIPVVYASSAAVYGNNPNIPLKETEILAPFSAYGADKLACELHSKIVAETFGISNIGLRFFNVYGPRQDASSPYSGVISIFTKRIMSDEPITIYGDGEHTRDFVYVGDVIAGIQSAIKKLISTEIHHGIFNICTGSGITVNQVADSIFQYAKKKSTALKTADRRTNVRHSIGCPKYSESILTYKSRIIFKDGIKHILEKMRE